MDYFDCTLGAKRYTRAMLQRTLSSARRGSGPASALIALTLGLLAIGLAAPRLYVEVVTLVGRGLVIRGQTEGDVDANRLESMAATLDDAARMSGSPIAYSLAGQAWLLVADRALENGQSAPAPLDAATAALRAAVTANPADPFGWARLTHAEYREGRPVAAGQAWHMSVLTGGYEPDLMERRLIQGWALRDWMEPSARDAFEEQLMLFWRLDPGEATLFSYRFGATPLMRRLLTGTPAALDDFDRRFASIAR